jgi:hypothetical protein
MAMPDITVPVPDDRVPEFYQFFGAWLAGRPAQPMTEVHQVGNPAVEALPWGQSDQDPALAEVVWGKLSKPAKDMFNVLLNNPGEKFSGEWLAENLGIEKGKYGVAGLLAWPGRHCYAVGRKLPVRYVDGVVGESADYWIEPDVAALFVTARDAE